MLLRLFFNQSLPLLALATLIISCERPRNTRVDSPLSNSSDSVLHPAEADGVPDTTSAAFKQRHLMSAPINTWNLAASDADTLRWLAQPDTCGLLIVSRKATRDTLEPRDNAVLVAEWFGSARFGDVWDIAPAPQWDWIAYGQARRVRSESDIDTVAAQTKTPRDEVTARAIRASNGARWLAIPVIEPLLDSCSGDDCPLNAASLVFGGRHVGWNRTGDAALVAGDNPPRWVALDPSTREPRQTDDSVVVPLDWKSRSIQDMVANPTVTLSSQPYRFVGRDDSIFVEGPDRTGRPTTRVVGRGIPVAATRNGQYLLAVRRDDREWRALVYEFVLFHAMMRSTCDRTT